MKLKTATQLIVGQFNEKFSDFYNASTHKAYLINMIGYNLNYQSQGETELTDESLSNLNKKLIELDGTLLSDIVSNFLKEYKIYKID